MHEWMEHINSFLQGLITLEGRGDFTDRICAQCRSPELKAKYWCLCCDNLGLVCQSCMVSGHQHMPFHRIEVRFSLLEIWINTDVSIQLWNGTYFSRSSLKSIGLQIQLGHPAGERCPCPNQTWGDDFIIIDCDQIHSVGLDYCGCGRSPRARSNSCWNVVSIRPQWSIRRLQLLSVF